jgi:hypothetical protein
MDRGAWTGRAPLFGLAAVVLFVIAFAVGGETPDLDSSGQEVVDYYASHNGSQVAAGILLAYGALFLALFASVLSNAFRRADRGAGSLAGLVLGGGILMSLGFAIFSGLTFTLADLGSDAEPAAAQALNALNNDFFIPLAIGTGIFMLASGAATLRGAALPRWLGWAGLVIGIAAVTPAGFFAVLASGIWIVIASVVLLRGRATPAETRTP